MRPLLRPLAAACGLVLSMSSVASAIDLGSPAAAMASIEQAGVTVIRADAVGR